MIYHEVKWKEIPQVLLDTAATTAIVMLLIGTSMGMSWIMSYENIPQTITAALIALSGNKIIILLIINLILLFVGTFMDMTPARVLIFTPIFLPIVTALGVHPIHFGIMMVLNLCIGLCTPPVEPCFSLDAELLIRPSESRQINSAILCVAMIAALLLITYFRKSLWCCRGCLVIKNKR
jgi:TRAP-type C4-dicarboxylate transport system permease large subunit